jgi:hypothetical protein
MFRTITSASRAASIALRSLGPFVSGLLLLTGCASDAPMGMKQVSCVALGADRGYENMTLIFDFGRRTVVRGSGSDHRSMPLAWNRYVYQFRDVAGHVFTLNRFDGTLKRNDSVQPAGRPQEPPQFWTCKSQKAGQAF